MAQELIALERHFQWILRERQQDPARRRRAGDQSCAFPELGGISGVRIAGRAKVPPGLPLYVPVDDERAGDNADRE
jgi:hypothetical protein